MKFSAMFQSLAWLERISLPSISRVSCFSSGRLL